MKKEVGEPELHHLRDNSQPTRPERTNSASDWSEGVPIALDIGSSHARIGYTSSDSTKPDHDFPTIISRYRDRKINHTYTLVGNDACLDPLAFAQVRSPFDGPLVSNWDLLETVLDYGFAKLNVQSHGHVENPIVMSEVLGVPPQQRRTVTELMFEAYGVPSLTFGVDALFAYYGESFDSQNNALTPGIAVHSGNEATYVIPMGNNAISQTKRINWGGNTAAKYLQSLLALKYPLFPSKLTLAQASCLYEDHCYVSDNYLEEVTHFLDVDGLESRDRVIQAPFTETVVVEKSAEELARIAEKRKESGRRLQEQAAKKRLEKLIRNEGELAALKELQEQFSTLNITQRKKALDREGYKDEASFLRSIAELEKAIKRARKQDVGDNDESGDNDQTAPPDFPLLDIPDVELNEEEIKEKRKQRLLKANYDARMRAREEKLVEKARKEEQERIDAKWREDDLDGWIADRREKYFQLVANRNERQKLKEELSDRKSLASQLRMKNIAALAADTPGRRGGSAKRRRGDTGGAADDNPNDTFGANDDDWAVYRDIANAVDPEEEEEEQNLISQLETELRKHDPKFELDLAEKAADWRKSTIHMFLRGPREFDIESQAQSYQMHMNIERIRVPEVLFQPAIAGVDQAGLVEVVGDMILRSSHSLANNIVLTGGNASLPGLSTRLHSGIRSMLPVNTPLKVYTAKKPSQAAWRGMAKWASSGSNIKQYGVTRAEYAEFGPEYMKEHGFGNAL